MTPLPDTIFAPASGQGRAAITVLRVSGPASRSVLEAMTGGVPNGRRLVLKTLRDPDTADRLDQALVAWMPGPGTFTGEDQAELHIHGGSAVRAAVLGALARIKGCRLAEPGEFTRRAFLNGRIDLSAAEGLADLIEAETEAQRRQAFRQLEGHLGQCVERWRERLIDALAFLEASLDFADEGDVGSDVEQRVRGELIALGAEMARALDDGRRGERLRQGCVVVLAGAPNAGKSTLLNAIARRDVAIVSEIPGTTRDALEVRCDLNGLPVTFVDTAGLRDAQDAIEQLGIARTRDYLSKADLVLWLIAPDVFEGEVVGPVPDGVPVLRVGTKEDLGGQSSRANCDAFVSAETGAGIPDLLSSIESVIGTVADAGDAVITRQRHRQALERALSCLSRAPAALAAGTSELAAEEVRLGLRALGEVTGRVDVEQVLERLFAGFCIGK